MELIKMTCAHDAKVIVDIDELRNSPRLQGAYIFKRLMCIEESEFKSQSLNKELFKDFNINERDWMDFIGFIRNGRIRYEIASNEFHDNDERKNYQKLLIQNLDNISNTGIFLKFGPFPVFDEYIEWTITNQKNNKINTKNENSNNPMTPEQDKSKRYIWRTGFTNQMDVLTDNGWSVTTNVLGTSTTFYIRRLRIPEQS
jgi:hypothetical protein